MIFFSLLSLLLFSSCSYFTKNIESLTTKPKEILEPNLKKKNYCPGNSKLQYISEDEYTLKFYKSLHPNLFENKKFTFIEKSIMLSLLEMSRRPDEASPYSRFQVYVKKNGKAYYYDFRPKKIDDDLKMPFLKGLDYLAKKFASQHSLLFMANQLDSLIPPSIGVSLEFESFLKNNRQDLIQNNELTLHFIKGDETITRYETFDRISYKKIIEQYLKDFSKNEDYEFEKNELAAYQSVKENYTMNCNFDLSKEISPHDEILNTNQEKSHYIALSEGEDFFLAVTSSTHLKPFKTSPKMSYFMKLRPAALPLPICEFKGKNQEIILFSSEGRNPVQHLQHLEAYEIDQIDSSFALNELLNFSRHLFLSNPDRILYESLRGRKAQLDFFLEMNFPIYHVNAIGNIFGYATFNNDRPKESALYSDDRSTARLWCKE